MDKDKYEIVFINDYATALLTAAFDAVSAYENLSAKRLDAAEVLIRYPTKPSKRTCFVFCRFEGQCFEHLRSLGAAIYGPQIILHYVRENQPLPRVPHPLYSTALMRAIATVTSVTGSEREHLLSSIQMLHGQASRDLFDGVNVVITPKVGSKKYLVGSSRGLHMLLPSWISEAWKLSAIQDPIDMMLPAYTERFRVPIFSQLVICVSGLSAEERKEVSDLVVKHGGRYSGMMRVGETTHLIIKHASGLKYSHAKKWKIQIVSVNWLTDSVNKGYALDEEDYRVSEEAKENASTPVRETNRRSFSFDTNLSVISHANGLTTRIDETRAAESFIHRPSTAPTGSVERPVLADCLIQLIDCTRDEQSTFSSLVNKLGGHLCTDLQDRVTETLTHVVVGSLNTTLNAAAMEKDVVYVKGSWLTACQEAHKRLDEADHLAMSAKNDVQTEQSGADLNEPTKRTMDTEDLQLINQYFGAGGLAEVDDFNRDSTFRANSSKDVTQGTVAQQSTVTVCEVPDVNETAELRTGCFTGFTFWLHSEVTESDKMDLFENIKGAGGRIVDSFVGASFIVAPFFIRTVPEDRTPDSKLVTVSWIEHCLAMTTVCWDDLNSEKAFTPLVRSGSLPLEGCVISLSGFVGRDRNLLTRYAQALGAIVQECFLCKAVPSRKLAASTHLVAAKLDGRKCPAAKQWGLPAVNREWLYACAERWCLADVAAYPVGDSAPTAKPVAAAVSAPPPEKIIQPEPVRDRRLTEIQQNAQLPSVRSVSVAQLTTTPTNNGSSTPLGSAATKQAMDTLHTPDWVQNNKADKTGDLGSGSFRESLGQAFKPSPPLSEQVARCLKKAVVRTAALPKRKLDLSDDSVEELPLKDVVICVAKHLSSRQVELNGVAKQLGGDFKWTYDPQICTHIIAEYQSDDHSSITPSRPVDQTPNTQPNLYADVLAAKQDGKQIVHPRWLTACFTAARRLPEADFLPSTKHLQPSLQQTAGREVESPPPTEPARKIPRTASSNLLGDVNRRLELMLGCPTKSNSAQAPDEASRDPPTLNLMAASAEGPSASADEKAPITLKLDGDHSFLAGGDGSGPRRLRRDPRRVMHHGSGVPTPGTPIINVNRGQNADDGCVTETGTTTTDRAQPGQSLMVRWQYEDAPPPRSPIDGATGTDPMANHRGVRSPTPANPGQGIVGIDHLASRDSISRRETPNTVATAAESSGTTVADATAKESKLTGQDPDQKKTPVVSFSGLASDERDHYAAIVSELGGEVDHQLTLSEKATHLIVHTPTRSEKCLICLASGRWMLHKSYLDACSRESRWVDETPYEWGGPGTEPLLMQLSPAVQARPGSAAAGAAALQQKQQAVQIRELARSARRWRLSGGRAFNNWRVIFGPGCDKETSFRRVIESGGGQVLSSKPPYPPASSVTHSFAKRRPNASNNNNASSTPLPRGYQWLRIDYLCAYLTAGQEVPRDEFLLS